MSSVDCIVVGAGVVGLAIARRLAMDGRETLVLERHGAFGTEASARNSEVIHAGIYYAPGSLKARLCVAGRNQLYDYCRERQVEHRRVGKLIVATDDRQLEMLHGLVATATRNGVTDLEWLDGRAVARLEPALRCRAALLSPSTGIVDSHALMLALLGDAERHGATLVLRSPVTGVRRWPDRVAVSVAGEAAAGIDAAWVINAAGLGAPALAACIEGLPAGYAPKSRFAKGNYFVLEGRSPFSHLIYPTPEPGGLGVHLTLDLAGRARFGPDVEWVDAPEYNVDPGRAAAFAAAIRSYWPGLPDGTLMPGYAGLRARITGPGEPLADFRIEGPSTHALPGVVNLFGIESPGLTSALAIADEVAALVDREVS